MSNKQDSSSFTEAIECLQEGNLETAEHLFRKTINELGKEHHQSHLSYKSLISIYTEQGEYKAALNTSLDLLDGQIAALGIRHAETSKTVNNIYTLCNTLGKHELAEEIMQMARAEEQKTVASSVKMLRGEETELEEEEEEGKIELPGAETMIGKITAPVNSAFNIMGKRLKRVVCIFILIVYTGIIFGALFGLKMMEGSDTGATNRFLNNVFVSASEDVQLKFPDSNSALAIIGEKSFTIPTDIYTNPGAKIGSLLLTPINSKEVWLYGTAQGINGAGNFTLYASDASEVDLITMMKNLMMSANKSFQRDQSYPEDFQSEEHKHMFEYDNPFTLRLDYPVVQKLRIPDKRFKSMEQLIRALKSGRRWSHEPFAYPGAINCGHIVAETKNSFVEKFVIHSFDRYGRVIKDSSGSAYLLVSRGGKTEEKTEPIRTNLNSASRIAIIDSRFSGYSLLLKNRLALFYAILAISYLLIAKFIPDKFASILSTLISLGLFGAALFALFIWFLPI